MTKIYTVMNPKGGVGKSTTTINLGTVGGMIGRKVLIIDCDPNMSSTKVLGIRHKLADSEFEAKNAFHLFKNEPKKPSEIAVSLDEFGFDFIPGTFDMQEVDQFLTGLRDGGMSWLLDLVEEDEGLKKYDEIFIDTGGRIGRLYTPLCIASDAILIPAQAARMAIDQVDEIIPFILQANKDKRRYFRGEVRIAAVFLNLYRANTTAAKENVSILLEKLAGTGIPLAKTKLPLATKVEQADNAGVPMVLFEPMSAISKAFFSLYKEVILGETVEDILETSEEIEE